MKTAIRRAPPPFSPSSPALQPAARQPPASTPAIRTAPDETTAAVIPLRGVQILRMPGRQGQTGRHQWAFIAPRR